MICSDLFRPVFAAEKPAAAAVLLAVVLAEITSLLQVQSGWSPAGGPAALISSTGKSVVVRDTRPRGEI